MKETKFPGIFDKGKNMLATKNMTPGNSYFSEGLFEEDGVEYRDWDPSRSKAGAAVKRGIKEFPISKGTTLLYLGIAQGYTSSFLSDVVGEEGVIYGVEISERAIRDLLNNMEDRYNIVPVHGDARKPETYEDIVVEKVDVVFCDIADPHQTKVALRNCKKYLKEGGYLMLSIKARSIDVTRDPKEIVKEDIEKIKDNNFEIVDWKMLDPWEKDHGFVVARLQ